MGIDSLDARTVERHEASGRGSDMLLGQLWSLTEWCFCPSFKVALSTERWLKGVSHQVVRNSK